MYLETINNPDDLKRISIEELPILAGEIRHALITRMSSVGGHLASNLGLVEATIALHYVFNSPEDKIIFDVSHQCYTHKILTGRKEGFTDPDMYHTVSGFTNPDESEHDLFRVGHTATSISLACGVAKARDLRGEKSNVIAVIGDGAFSGGEAFEGLDFAGGEIAGNFIVLFNDNQMSIAENHGGMYGGGLKELRDTNGQAENNLFRAFGFDYIFVGDGHNIRALIDAFQSVKDSEHPVVVHVVTTKGKGYKYSEENQEITHWIRPFDIETGKEKNLFQGERYDRIARDHLLERMKADHTIVTIFAATADILSFTKECKEQAGNQYIDVGIAEEHAVSMAAGLAQNGCKPIFATSSTFFQRTYDQILQELCINKMPVTLLVLNASVFAPNEITHMGIYDIPMMSNIPNLVYLAPTNKQEYMAMLDWSIDQNEHPVAIRVPRNGVFYAKDEVETDYSRINTFQTLIAGEKVAALALGDFFQMGEELVKTIQAKCGFTPTLINPRYITGIDKSCLEQLKKDHSLVVTLEDGVLDGGWGQKVASFYGSSDMKVLNYGLKKEFLDRYNIQKVLERNRLKPDLILEDILCNL